MIHKGETKLIRKFIKYLIRKKQIVKFNDLNTDIPVSRLFGLDRGVPIDRFYIEKFLELKKEYIVGNILEVGDDYYSRKFSDDRNHNSINILHVKDQKAATIVGDLSDKSTLPENRFDCFICTQTFNFIYDVPKALLGAYHMLKPGGVLLATVAGISQISRFDMDRWGDYWRFTTLSMDKLVKEIFHSNSVEVESYGNVLAAISFLQGIVVEDLPNPELLITVDNDYQVIITIFARK